ncbi:MAG TPA: tetratricopeptide repeat protein [Dongiaceae bacterium]|jgi:tetratricopeptide (TPR) repeat protein|nr:tetratricopeptide repeat protein [Dongiaceae bacterium]
MQTVAALPAAAETDLSTGPLLTSLGSATESAAQELAAIRDRCLVWADQWYAAGELVVARNFLQHAAEVAPDISAIWVALGSLDYELGEYESAARSFNRAARLAPQTPRIYVQLGLAHQQLKHGEEAEACFLHAVALAPHDLLVLRLAAKHLLSDGNFAVAREVIETALLDQPNDLDLLLQLGVCCYRMEEPTAARACFERVLQLAPNHELARENLSAIELAAVGQQ